MTDLPGIISFYRAAAIALDNEWRIFRGSHDNAARWAPQAERLSEACTDLTMLTEASKAALAPEELTKIIDCQKNIAEKMTYLKPGGFQDYLMYNLACKTTEVAVGHAAYLEAGLGFALIGASWDLATFLGEVNTRIERVESRDKPDLGGIDNLDSYRALRDIAVLYVELSKATLMNIPPR